MSALAAAVPARPAGPRNLIPFQALLQFRRNAPEYLQSLSREYGDVVFFHLGQQNVFFVNDPDVIKDVLVTHQNKFAKSRMLQRAKVLLGEGLLTSEGQHHLRQRRLAQPAFHRDRLRGYGESMIEFAVRTRDRWQPGQTLNIATEMMQLTLAVVAKTLFNADVDADAGDIGESLGTVLELFNTVLLPFSEYLEKLPLPSVKRFERARSTLDQIIYRIIGERRQKPGDHGDLLSMLLMAVDEDGSGGMSDKQVRDEALTIFLAGHETTAVALTWTLYLLSQNPDVEARLVEELDRVLNGRLPTVDDMANLKYVEQVFAEGMRLYPPAWAIGRMATEPYTMPGPHNWELSPGDIVLMSTYVTHRDGRHFPEPTRFDPERWKGSALAEHRAKFSFFPFGGGTRVCIGERFAWMEGIFLLAVILQRWKLTLDASQVVDKRALLTLRPKHGMRMKVEARR